MSKGKSASERPARMADRLEAARRGRFVGRSDILTSFREILLQPESPFAVLHIHGPGGVGKTTLLREFARIARAADRPVARLDGRLLEPAPNAFLGALDQSGIQATPAQPHSFHRLPPTCVLLIDTYELIEPLDTWLREVFLPQLSPQGLAVIVGRNAPSPAWRTDTDWGELTRIVTLGNFSPEESATYLTARDIPDTQHAAALRFTGGHPLALALVADTLQRGGEIAALDPGSEPDLVRALLERLVREIPSPSHQRALDACVIARLTTEDLLAGIGGIDDPHACFEWLRRQAFVEHSPYGIFPHDLAREVLLADFRWRNPHAHNSLVGRIWTHLWRRIGQTDEFDRQRLQLEALYVIRNQPNMTSYFDWNEADKVFAEEPGPEETEAILEIVHQHEGPESARIAAHWLRRQPESFHVFRDRDLDAFGFMAQLALHHATAEDVAADPAAAAALRFIERFGPLADRQEVIYLRFWMHRERYQEITAATNLMAVDVITRCVTTSNLAWNFIAMSDPEFWTPHFNAVNFPRAHAAGFAVDGRPYGVFAHDWRIEPALVWLTTGGTPMPFTNVTDDIQATPPPLSEAEFATAVRQALRDFARDDRLATNPLLRAGSVRTGSSNGASPTDQCGRCCARRSATLDGHPRDIKFHRALWHTYIEPAPTQERAAELLGVPFNTYRYQLARGLERVTAHLWWLEHRDSSELAPTKDLPAVIRQKFGSFSAGVSAGFRSIIASSAVPPVSLLL